MVKLCLTASRRHGRHGNWSWASSLWRKQDLLLGVSVQWGRAWQTIIRVQISQGLFRRCIQKEFPAPLLGQLCWIRSVITNFSGTRKETRLSGTVKPPTHPFLWSPTRYSWDCSWLSGTMDRMQTFCQTLQLSNFFRGHLGERIFLWEKGCCKCRIWLRLLRVLVIVVASGYQLQDSVSGPRLS